MIDARLMHKPRVGVPTFRYDLMSIDTSRYYAHYQSTFGSRAGSPSSVSQTASALAGGRN